MYTLSIILNMHHGSELVERVIKNLRYMIFCAHKARKNWDKVEVIAVIDNADDVIKHIVNANLDLFAKVEFVSFGDLAQSRNHGVKIANNNFILSADDDDYFSHNALIVLYDTFKQHYSRFKSSTKKFINNLEYKDHIAVFPQLLVEFPRLWIQSYVDSNENIKNNMKFSHCFVSRISCLRKILLENKMRKNELPYGFEDWDLNNRLLASGVNFKVAPGYTLYYRKSNSASLLHTQIQNKCIVRNSAIYDYTPEPGQGAQQKNNLISKKPKNKFLTMFSRETAKSRYTKSFKHDSYHLSMIEDCEIDIYIQVHKNFLLNYHEKNLSISCARPIGDTLYYSRNITAEMICFNQIKQFIKGKNILLITVCHKLNKVDSIISEHINLLDTNSIGVITIFQPDTNAVGHTDIPCFDLNSMDLWSGFGEENGIQLHVLLKAIVNSKIEYLYCVESDLGSQLINYYHRIFDEYNIKVIMH